MNLSIIIPWKNRLEFSESLKQNFIFFDSNHLEIIVVNFGGDIKKITKIIKESNLKNIKLINIENNEFNKCKAINIGVFQSTNDVIFLLDCDIILNNRLNEEVNNSFLEDKFITLNKAVESQNQEKDKLTGEINEISYFIGFKGVKGNEILVETKRIFLSENARSTPGLVILTKENFIKVGGMNSELCGWGWEDIDLLYRLEYHGVNRLSRGNCIHLSHSDNKRHILSTNKEINEKENFKKSIANYLIGYFLGTYDEDLKSYNY